MIPRVFVQPAALGPDEVVIEGQDAAHIGRVLRLRPGDAIVVCDGQGWEYPASVTRAEPARVRARLLDRQPARGEPPVELVLVQGLAKGEKMDLVVQKATELGVARIVPVRSGRSVVELSGAKAQARRQRWQRIAAEAAKQSGRGRIPEVAPVTDLAAAVRDVRADLTLIPWEEERDRGLKEVLQGLAEMCRWRGSRPGRIAAVIGPEGGLTAGEVRDARAAGAVSVTLGPRILRTETAGLALLSIVLYEIGDLGDMRSETRAADRRDARARRVDPPAGRPDCAIRSGLTAETGDEH